jgi:hypothetical protein
MPLILLGLLVVIGIVLYALVMYGQSGEEDTRPVRERYPFAFPQKKKSGANYTVIEDDDEEDDDRSGESNNTMHFPEDAEVEKRKRNIDTTS